VDTIEPALDQEVQIQVSGDGLLAIEVTPREEQKPYALILGCARLFCIRVADRIRLMTREELWTRPARDRLALARKSLTDLRDEARRAAKPLLWLGIVPEFEARLDVQAPRFGEYLRDPAKTGNRRMGWQFANPDHEPRIGAGALTQEKGRGPKTVIRSNGSIEFSTPMTALWWKGPENEIWPFAVLEYPTSILRLARAVYGDLEKPRESRILADLALFATRGWALRPHSPTSIDFAFGEVRPYQDRNLTFDEPLTFRLREILEEPDRCAFRLLRRIYEGFGHREDAIPEEFRTGRLLLRE
jgi:hypothetical protein